MSSLSGGHGQVYLLGKEHDICSEHCICAPRSRDFIWALSHRLYCLPTWLTSIFSHLTGNTMWIKAPKIKKKKFDFLEYTQPILQTNRDTVVNHSKGLEITSQKYMAKASLSWVKDKFLLRIIVFVRTKWACGCIELNKMPDYLLAVTFQKGLGAHLSCPVLPTFQHLAVSYLVTVWWMLVK